MLSVCKLVLRSGSESFSQNENGIRLMLAPRSANARFIHTLEILKNQEIARGLQVFWVDCSDEKGTTTSIHNLDQLLLTGAGAGDGAEAWFFLSKSNARTISLSSATSAFRMYQVDAIHENHGVDMPKNKDMRPRYPSVGAMEQLSHSSSVCHWLLYGRSS
ncbi:hypothetical protein Tco_0877581 [Tanacetum coccineum]|uniref:Uncharacterized protein n=1 Tax=Tanacetum coccineum TaxID=301880 RepID=A0ABQ5BVJ9_9ASTR